MKPSIAVIGTGYWGQNLVRSYANLGQLRTVCDIDEIALRRIENQYPQVIVTRDYGTVLRDPEVTAVVVALPAALHHEFAKQALEANKDVYVEKPLALSVEDGEDLVRMAKANGRILMVGHLLHYHPTFIRLKEMVKTHELGTVQYIYSNRLSLGKIRREESSLWSFAPHDISMILALAGESPTQVWAFGANYLQAEIADVTHTHLSFASGIRAHIFVSWLHPFKEQKLVVVAEEGMAVFEDTQEWDKKLAVYRHSIKWDGGLPVPHKAEVEYVPVEKKEPLLEECAHFLRCIETREHPSTDGEEGLRVLRVLHQAQSSLQTR